MFDETMNEINENEEMEEVTTLVETDNDDSAYTNYDITITEENKPDMGLLALAGIGAAAFVGGVTFGVIKLVKWGKKRKEKRMEKVTNKCATTEVSDVEFEEVNENETENETEEE